jgi:hypothetical protein
MSRRLIAWVLLLGLVAGVPLPSTLCRMKPVAAATCECEPSGAATANRSHCPAVPQSSIRSNCCHLSAASQDRRLTGALIPGVLFRAFPTASLDIGLKEGRNVSALAPWTFHPPDRQAFLCLFLI